MDCLSGYSCEIPLLRHMCLSSRCDGHAPMHAALEQKQRDPSSPLLRHMGFECPPCFTYIAGITVTTIDLVHNAGLVIIRNTILWVGENSPKCSEGLHVDLKSDRILVTASETP